jgi:oligoribonuclease
MSKKDDVTKLLWVDMEMTGLDVNIEVPIEIAGIITDWKFQPLSTYHTIIKQPAKYLDAMDDWNQKHHRESGLLALIPSGTAPPVVDQEFAAWIGEHFGSERPILAGNSINQDRLFIRKYMPLTEAKLHYRMLDVTSWKIVFNGLYGKKYKKQEPHRALEDIRESIDEFKFYLSFITATSSATATLPSNDNDPA